ncbi:MAG: MOSC domain-containing protein [Pseudonocardia sp.]|nr:MOSC domain-containing protein [Pseudonocardia sp.]
MKITTLRRYPVKSMLGETVASLTVDECGAHGDRRLALIDIETGRVATAKHPRLWRSLLMFTASGDPGRVRIDLPGGGSVAADEAGVDELLSGLLGRQVRLAAKRPDAAEVERPAPEDVLKHGVEADVEFATLVISQGTPGTSFVDYAPVHLITTATLEHIGTEALRYRPNLVVTTPPGYPPYAENDWVGRELRIGEARLRGVLPTPRCSVPTLEHGELPRAVHAVRVPMAENRVDVEGFGVLPCAGVYLEVLEAGRIRSGDEVTLG